MSSARKSKEGQTLPLPPPPPDDATCLVIFLELSTTAVPNQTTCDELLKCMMGCQNGYKIGSVDTSGCPICSCKSGAFYVGLFCKITIYFVSFT